ncbi:hypothetical protein LCGC14_2947280, partial [marine sediment metagenome]
MSTKLPYTHSIVNTGINIRFTGTRNFRSTNAELLLVVEGIPSASGSITIDEYPPTEYSGSLKGDWLSNLIDGQQYYVIPTLKLTGFSGSQAHAYDINLRSDDDMQQYTYSGSLGDSYAADDFYLNYNGPNGDAFINVFKGHAAGRHIKYDNGDDRFEFNTDIQTPNDIDAGGDITAQTNVISVSGFIQGPLLRSNSHMYINFDGGDGNSSLYFYENGSSTGAKLMWNDGTSKFNFDQPLLVTGNLDVSGEVIATGRIRTDFSIYNNNSGPDADSYVFFYEGGSNQGRWLKWDDSDNRFEFNDSLVVTGDITAANLIATTSGSSLKDTLIDGNLQV